MRKAAQILGIVGGLIGLIPGLAMVGLGLAGFFLFAGRDSGEDWGRLGSFIFIFYGAIASVIGGLGLAGGLIVSKNPLTGATLQFAACFSLVAGLILGSLFLQYNPPVAVTVILVIWPLVFLAGGGLALRSR